MGRLKTNREKRRKKFDRLKKAGADPRLVDDLHTNTENILAAKRRLNMEKTRPGNQIKIPMKGGVIAPGILPGVKPSDLTKVVCGNIIDGERCGHNLFIPISQLMHATRFQTATAQPTIVNFPGNWACAKCAALNNFHIPGVTDKEEPKPVEETSDGKTIQ